MGMFGNTQIDNEMKNANVIGDLSGLRDPLITLGGKFRIEYHIGSEDYVNTFTLEDITRKGLYVFTNPAKRTMTYKRCQIPGLLASGKLREV